MFQLHQQLHLRYHKREYRAFTDLIKGVMKIAKKFCHVRHDNGNQFILESDIRIINTPSKRNDLMNR